MLVDEVKITEADHRRELLVQDALKVNTLNVGVDHIKHLEDTAEALSREAEKAAESLQVLPGMHNIHKHVAEHARRSIELLRAKKAEEDMRRARGEIVTEELTPEELQRLERDARKHNHQPMEVPPLEAAIIVLFIIAVAFGYQWSNKALLRDAKRQ